MGRPRTPTSILDGKGGFLTHKNRQRPNEPVTKLGIGKPPAWYTAEEKKMWKLLARKCAPGVLMESDWPTYCILVRLMSKYHNHPDSMRVMETNQLISVTRMFGLSPSERSRVSVEAPKTSSLSQFLARKVV